MSFPDAQEILRRIQQVRRRIDQACAEVDRDPGGVRLVTVTKGVPDQVVREAHAAGLRDFGENLVETLIVRISSLADLDGTAWHLIGPLQSRKVGLVPASVALLHAVDRIKIARRLDTLGLELGAARSVLLECNVSGEASKSGWRMDREQAWAEAEEEILEVCHLGALDVRGLMTMAPQAAGINDQRTVFRRLARLRDHLARRSAGPLPELSMGMSDDFEAAVAEGATLVRIGRAILGERS